MCIAPVPLRMDSIKWKSRKPLQQLKGDVVNVPCGKCIECRRSYVNQWCVRLMAEYNSPKTRCAYFLTVTYDDLHLYDPVNDLISPDGEYQLNYKHFQDFMKRLRKSYTYRAVNPKTGKMKTYYDKVPKIKYFTVGEYGDKSDRPHFHAIIFNADQQNICDTWDMGAPNFGEVNEKTIKYTLKYAMKKIGRVHKSDYNKTEETRTAEKALISNGLGIDFLTPETINYYNADITRNIRKAGGQIAAMPRYYKNKIYTDAQREARSRVNLTAMDRLSTPEALAERKAIAHHEYQKETAKQESRKATGS